MINQELNYVVGEEKRLSDIIGPAEVVPLLEGAIRAGATEAVLADADGRILWNCTGSAAGTFAASLPVFLEGEIVGTAIVKGVPGREELVAGLVRLLAEALKTIVVNNLKRMLTTEIHTSVVNQSYEELMETNRRLAKSEAGYRDLSESLEKKVEERTEELKLAHARLLQQEKMASIGQLAAGVAHEINNPLGFITSNLATLQKYVARFLVMLDHYRSLLDSGCPVEEARGRAEEKWRELRLDVIRSDVADLLIQSFQGAERVKNIVADLKGFSHLDDAAEAMVDINKEIDRTLNVLSHEIPEGTEIERLYQPLPFLSCNGGLICQVFSNIIRNALQASRGGLKLQLATAVAGTAVRISIRDNGPGIPADIRTRIFEPFFTTREVGTGTGMGLAVVYDIVTCCGGSVSFDCPSEGGAVFTVLLPQKRN